MKIIGFAKLPRAVATIAPSAAVFHNYDALPSRLFGVSRRGALAVGFEVDDTTPNSILDRGARRSDVAAHAICATDAAGGLVVANIKLRRAYGGDATVWVRDMPIAALAGEARAWFGHVAVASQRMSAARPAARGDVVEINIIGSIGDGAYDGREVGERIRAAAGRPIIANIDSRGGAVADALGIYHQLRAHRHAVETRILGDALSAAAIVALAGDCRLIAPNGRILLHEPHLDGQRSRDCTSPAERAQLAAITNDFCKIIATRAGADGDMARLWLEGEFEFNANQALGVGLVHGLLVPEKSSANVIAAAPIVAAQRPRAPIVSFNRQYFAGDRVQFCGRDYVATRRAIAAPGFEPPRNARDWRAA